MTEKLLSFLFLFLLSFSTGSSFAFANEGNVAKHQEYGLPFITNYKPQEYGADPVNWAMIQNDRGFIHGGNQKGLLEYDGSTWKLIKLPGNSNIRSFTKTSKGRIYVGGYGELGYLDVDSIGQIILMVDELAATIKILAEVLETRGTRFLNQTRWNLRKMH